MPYYPYTDNLVHNSKHRMNSMDYKPFLLH